MNENEIKMYILELNKSLKNIHHQSRAIRKRLDHLSEVLSKRSEPAPDPPSEEDMQLYEEAMIAQHRQEDAILEFFDDLQPEELNDLIISCDTAGREVAEIQQDMFKLRDYFRKLTTFYI